MSKEVFLLPSAKQILSYENGDIRSDEISTVYRFHFLNSYVWIEPSTAGYEIRVRGKFPSKDETLFIPVSRTVKTAFDLHSAIVLFKGVVKDFILLHDLYTSDSPDFNFGD